MSIRTWPRGESHQKCDEPSRVDRRRDKKAAEEKRWLETCRAVNVRDQYRCRACGRACDPSSPDMLKRGHHHHLTFRSRGGNDTTDNVCLLDAECHSLLHKHVLDIRGNADEALEVWRLSKDHGWYLSARELAPHVWARD